MNTRNTTKEETRIKLLEAALLDIRTYGYAATSVDTLCAEAGVSKGAFFHHFKSKEDLAVQAAEYFSTMAQQLFKSAPYRNLEDPLERLLGYVDFRIDLLQGSIPSVTCLLGTMVQEVHHSHPAIRIACEKELAVHIKELVADAAAAKELYAPTAEWTPESLGYYMQSVLQGAFIFAKANQDAKTAEETLSHLRRYIDLLYTVSTTATVS